MVAVGRHLSLISCGVQVGEIIQLNGRYETNALIVQYARTILHGVLGLISYIRTGLWSTDDVQLDGLSLPRDLEQFESLD